MTREDGVVVQKIGSSYMFIFPSTHKSAVGKISVGRSITVMYGLQILGGGRARFIGLDATKASRMVPPKLTVENGDKFFGFLVKDTHKPTLDIFVKPSFMSKLNKVGERNVRQTISRQGNMDVYFGQERNQLTIIGVVLD